MIEINHKTNNEKTIDTVIRYSEFGAVGDGVADDFLAIEAAHKAANLSGAKVMAESGATYYLGKSSHGKTVMIKTDVDWLDARFIIDDTEITPNSGNRGYNLFRVISDRLVEEFKADDGTLNSENTALSIGDTELPATVKKLIKKRCMAIVYNSAQKIFIRYGDNASSLRQSQREILVVNADGTIDVEQTPLMWSYPQLTAIKIYDIEDEPITIEGGVFVHLANRLYDDFTEEELNAGWLKGNQYYYYDRGFLVERSNVTVRNVKHYIEGEVDGGYPYAGWFGTQLSYNVTFEDLVVTGHKTYLENRPNGRGTPMGSYDIGINSSVSVTYKRCVQSNDINDYTRWGVMGSNFCRNITYDGCTLSRFDAHEGVYNATVKNSVLGHSFNLVGAGTALIENTVKTGGYSFIDFRGDYGSYWRGDIIIRNCEMQGDMSIIFSGQWIDSWRDWDFGYKLSMPQNIIIDNLSAQTEKEALALFGPGYNDLSEDDLDYIDPPRTLTVINQKKKIDLQPEYLKSIRGVTLQVSEQYESQT